MAAPSGTRQPTSDKVPRPVDETQRVDQRSPRGAARPEQRGGYDCDFVETPQELQTDCPICLVVLREPLQVTCCGNSFCRTCIETGKKVCPTCNDVSFSAFPNKGLQRALYSFRVRCVNQKSGCEWTGELGELERHLNVNPEQGKQLLGCVFAEIACTHCCEYFQRRHVHAHQTEACPQRPFSCDYCEDYRSVYEDIVNNHWPVCKCYPVSCPNECGVSPERQNVETHVNTVCPLTVVNCDFHYAGCEVQLVRKDMPTHLAESLATHISLLTTQTQTLAGRGGQDNLLLRLSLLALHNQQLTQLTIQQKESLEECQRKIQELEREKQAQATELRNCSEAGKHEALKLKSIEQEVAKLRRREDSLEKGQHKVQELERELKESSEAGEREIKALKQGMNKDEVAGLRKQRYRNKINYCSLSFLLCLLGIGFSFFLFPPWKQASETEGLKLQDAALRRQLKQQHDEAWSSLAALYQHTMLPPVEFTLTGFKEMKNNDSWYSPPFYTHPQGYKMCLRVDAMGKGTRVSVFGHLMRGEFDDYLKWPFQGHVTVAILNQLEDNNHATTTIDFPDTTGRVTNGERAPSGYGRPTFIAHTDLNHKSAKNYQYLKYDCLRFRIVKVELK